jgi:hypothetical protein
MKDPRFALTGGKAINLRNSRRFAASKLAVDFVSAEMSRLNLTTAFDIARFAAKLTENIFVD